VKNKNMNPIISFALVLCLLLAFLPTMQVSASEIVQVRVSDISNARPGDVVNVHIYLDSNPGLFGLGLALNIDPNVFERLPSTAAAVAAPGPFTLGALSTPAQQPVRIALPFEGPYNDANTYYTGRIAIIPLVVLEDAPLGLLTSALTLEAHAGGPLNINFQVPPMAITQGSVNVQNAPNIIWGDLTGTGSVGMADLMMLRQYLAGIVAAGDIPNYAAAAVSGNATVGMPDLMLMRQYLNDVISIFPAAN